MRWILCSSLLLALSTPASSQEAATYAPEGFAAIRSPARWTLRPEALYRQDAPPEASAPGEEGAATDPYLEVKAGPLFFIDDFNHLNPGFDTEVVFGLKVVPILAFELLSGYLRGDDTDGAVERRLWGVPLLVNAKLTIPGLLLHPYIGAGVGGFYLHAEEETAGQRSSDSDVVIGWNAFGGIDFEVGPIFLEGEVKYILTDKADVGGGPSSLEGLALLAGLGIRF